MKDILYGKCPVGTSKSQALLWGRSQAPGVWFRSTPFVSECARRETSILLVSTLDYKPHDGCLIGMMPLYYFYGETHCSLIQVWHICKLGNHCNSKFGENYIGLLRSMSSFPSFFHQLCFPKSTSSQDFKMQNAWSDFERVKLGVKLKALYMAPPPLNTSRLTKSWAFTCTRLYHML